MSLWRQIARGLRVLTDRAAADRDVADEVEHYLELATAEHVGHGLSPEQARRAARLELGSPSLVREQVRAYGWESLVGTAWADLRYAGRRLRRSPGFATVCVLTLALGIGASTAIFSAVDPILFAPLPYPRASRLVSFSDVDGNGGALDLTYGTYHELAQRSRSFASLAVADHWRPALTSTAEPERLEGDRVSAGYFRTLGVAPALGRDFDAADEQVGAPRVVIVSDGLLRRRFGGQRSTLGRPITLDGDEYTVIGIMPRDLENVLSPTASVWAPLRYRANAPFESAEWGHHLRMIGRLAESVPMDRARREIAGIARVRSADFPRPPWAAMQQGLRVERLQDAVTRGVRPALLAIFGAVLLVLALAGVNVTNLLLARGAQRRNELAMRAALGAARRRIVRQLLTETLLLAAIGGLAGLVVAGFGVRALAALAPAGLPRASAIRLDGAAFSFALALTALIGVAVGLVPAIWGAHDDLRAGANAGARATRGAHHGVRRGLVVTEVALAFVLLVGAGLLLRSLQHLFAIAPGFDASHVLTMQVEAAGHRYDSNEAAQGFYEQALDAVRHLPGVTGAAFTSQLPLSGDLDGYGLAFESAPTTDARDVGAALRYAVTPDWFRTMRIPLLGGRLLGAQDRPGMPEAIVINESFAKRMFPGQNPVGQRVRIGPEMGRTDRPWDIVVGVVGDVKQTSLALGEEDAFYVAMGQWSWVDNVQSLAVRTAGDPGALVPAVERAIRSVDPSLPIMRVATMEHLVEASEAQRQFVLIVFEAFALAALLLAGLGMYGVLAGGVAERTREIGVRAALGASRGSILALVLRQGMALTVIGVAIGLMVSVASTRAIASLLFGLSRLDPLTHVGVIGLLAAVSALACALPAWRAARVDPAITLRAD